MSRFDDALVFAAEVYAGKVRKGSINPFILHPMEAAAIAAELTADEDILIAALLHDAVEDAGCPPEEIGERFGKRVLSLVLADTEPADEDWMDRKIALLRYLKHKATRDEKIVILADRLSNIRSIYSDLRLMGKDVWEIFHEQSDPELQHWFYRESTEHFGELSGTPALEEYRELVRKVFSD